MEDIIKILKKIRDILSNQEEINSLVEKRLDDLELRVSELERYVLYNKDD